MTPEQEKKLFEIGQILKETFKDYYGSIRFNLKPDRNIVNVNIEQSLFLKDGDVTYANGSNYCQARGN